MQTFQRDETREHAAAIREQVALLRMVRDATEDRLQMLRMSASIGELERTAQRLEAMVQRDEDRERKETAVAAAV